jgi:acetyltransferase-like isoleucine patch superfamily enzyme
VARLAAGVSRSFVALHGIFQRAHAKAFSVASSGAFAGFGRHSVIEPPVRLGRPDRIWIGDEVYVGAGSWLQVLPGPERNVAISIGDGTSIAGSCVLSASSSITLGRKVLLARNVYIADHMHAFHDQSSAVLDQGIDRVAPVEIGDGAWLGQNVVVGPGVRIGRGAVVGSNAVVLESVPDRTVVAGVPARTIRQLDGVSGERP